MNTGRGHRQSAEERLRMIKSSPILSDPDGFARDVLRSIAQQSQSAPALFFEVLFRPVEKRVPRFLLTSIAVVIVMLFCVETLTTLISIHQLEARYGVQRERIPGARVSYSLDLSTLPLDSRDRETLAAFGIPMTRVASGITQDDIPPLLRSTLSTIMPRHHQSVERIIKSIRTRLIFDRAG
jgi:CRP-like cAMP-binding protein